MVVPEANAEDQRVQEEADARLRDQGPLPFIADLEACQRVAAAGLGLFRPMAGGYSVQVSQTLRGKIASTTSENYRFAGRLKEMQAKLDSQRNTRFLDISKENRDLKEEVKRLQGLKKKLNEANDKVIEQAKQLEELLKAKQERDRARQAEKRLREESARLKQQVAQLAKGKADAEKQCATTSVGSFQHAVDMTGALAFWVNWKFFDGKHYAKDKKIWLCDEMVYDPALHRDAEEEEEGSPEGENANEEKAEDQTANGENPK